MSKDIKAGVIGPIYAAPINATVNAENVPWAKPIRIYQFILVLILFFLTWQTISNETAYGPIEGALTLTLFGTYLLITLIDMLSQCGSDPIPDTPMFLFGVFGVGLFLMTACNIIMVTKRENITGIVKLMISTILTVACLILFLVDIMLIFLYGY